LAISSWYEYSRSNGIRFNTNYPTSLATAITDDDNLAHCEPVRAFFDANDGDETGDYTPFWVERDYVKDVGNVATSVFAVHGLQDDNVKTDDFAKWWDQLSARDVPRKIWLTGTGHVEAFDFRRAEWVSTIHRWFDYWLQGYPNGIMDEPMADVEVGPDVWETYGNWPVPGTEDVTVWLRPGEAAGTLALTPEPGKPQTRSFTDNPSQGENTAMSNPKTPSPSKLAFLSRPLERELRISGAPRITIRASSSLDTAYLGAILVEYGTKTRISRSGNGIVTEDVEDCWGASSATDDACYFQVSKRLQTASQWRVARGILDGQNRSSVAAAEPLVPGEEYDFTFRLYPNDYVFSAGEPHRRRPRRELPELLGPPADAADDHRRPEADEDRAPGRGRPPRRAGLGRVLGDASPAPGPAAAPAPGASSYGATYRSSMQSRAHAATTSRSSPARGPAPGTATRTR
jgi:X-Pro dipeptidyl-peptidase